MNDTELAVAAALRGAAIVREGFGAPYRADLKGRFNPVTDVDLRSERAIVELITAERPGDGILAEEGGAQEGGGRRWLVDPLDGTVNFVHGIPQVSVSVAVYDGPEALAAVVVDPIRGEVFAATTGAGATLDGAPLAVSTVDELSRAVIVTGFPYDHDRHAAGYVRTVGAVLEHVNGVRRFGSAALDLAWLAAGRFDGFWEYSLAPWDTAAGIVLVREAGGIVSDALGEPFTPGGPHIVAANPAIHGALRGIVATTLPPHLA
ncbi:MAG: inositol monophosphatase family protein [Acidimicrobiia bacterium]|jgi:myo-inositol-1(or 4)-monophosphatase